MLRKNAEEKERRRKLYNSTEDIQESHSDLCCVHRHRNSPKNQIDVKINKVLSSKSRSKSSNNSWVTER